jgi:chromosome segregation ATPase
MVGKMKENLTKTRDYRIPFEHTLKEIKSSRKGIFGRILEGNSSIDFCVESYSAILNEYNDLYSIYENQEILLKDLTEKIKQLKEENSSLAGDNEEYVENEQDQRKTITILQNKLRAVEASLKNVEEIIKNDP